MSFRRKLVTLLLLFVVAAILVLLGTSTKQRSSQPPQAAPRSKPLFTSRTKPATSESGEQTGFATSAILEVPKLPRRAMAARLNVPPRSLNPQAAAIERITFGTRWGREERPELVAFSNWAERYVRAATLEQRIALEGDGVKLAESRREVLAGLITKTPREAIEATVPLFIRQQLPAPVQAQLERRVGGVGRISLSGLVPEEKGLVAEPIIRTAMVNGEEFRAYTYGQRAQQGTRQEVSIQGIAVDRSLAVLDSPVRALDFSERPAAAQLITTIVVETQPVPTAKVTPVVPAIGNSAAKVAAIVTVTQKPAALPLASGTPAFNVEKVTALQYGNAIVIATSPEQVPKIAENLAKIERAAGPSKPVLTLGNTPVTVNPEAEYTELPALEWTHGAKRLLLIRVDFPDRRGQPIAGGKKVDALAASKVVSEVNAFYQQNSYGKTSVSLRASDVTPVFTVSKTATYYAVNELNDTLHEEAQNLAAAGGYNLEDYDRIAVIFSSLGKIRFSKITYGGLANVGWNRLWFNGKFDFGVVAHELGHTYGVHHANLWRTTDQSVIGRGSSVEYGDLFDVMGDSWSATSAYHFNHLFKNVLGWIPDEAVETVIESGTYRVYRFDTATADLTLPLALRVPRMNRDNDYWIGYRKLFPQLQGSACVLWGKRFNSQSDLLDMTTPGYNARDAGLLSEQTFTDNSSSIILKNLGVGVDEQGREYLDIEVTMIAVPLFSSQPQMSQTATAGGTITLTASVESTGRVAYQWQKDGVDILGSARIGGTTTGTLVIRAAQVADAGRYTLKVIYEGGALVSDAASVEITALARPGALAWVRQSGGSGDYINYGNAVAVDKSGNVFVVGDFIGQAIFGDVTLTSAGETDLFLAKYDQNGALQWVRRAGGAGADAGNHVAVDAAGNAYITGWFRDSATFGNATLTNAGEYTAFVARYDTNGNLRWAVRPDSSQYSYGSSVAVDSSGNVIFAGTYEGTMRLGKTDLRAVGQTDAFLAKLDSNGRATWALTAGGGGEDFAASVALDASGNPHLAGSFSGNAYFGRNYLSSLGESDIFVAKFDKAGVLQWARSGGGRGSDFCGAVTVDRTGAVVVVGDFERTAAICGQLLTSAGGADIFVARYTADGQPSWSQRAGGIGMDSAYGVAVDAESNIHVVGEFQGKVGFGTAASLISFGEADIFVAKYASTGAASWAKKFGGLGHDTSGGLALDSSGGIHIIGGFAGEATFDSSTLTSGGLLEFFLLKIVAK